jgi:phosphoribosylamine---glycine ligase
MRVFFIDVCADALDLALRTKEAGHEVRVRMDLSEKNKRYRLVGKGLVERTSDLGPGMRWADLIVLCGNETGMREIDKFRAENPKKAVFGPNIESASWEIDRQKGMKVLERRGIKCPPTYLCHTYEQAVAYVKKRDTRLVCKPCADADKALSYCSKGPEDMLFMLDKWRRENKIKCDFILQDFIPGVEFAVGGYMGKYGLSTWYEEGFEHKKFMVGEVGPNTGEMGTVMQNVRRSKLARNVLCPLEKDMMRLGCTGCVDVNCIIDDKGTAWPLEWTMRLGFPATQIRAATVKGDPVQWMHDIALGKGDGDFETKCAVGVAMCMPPFPYDSAPAELALDFPVFGVTPRNRDRLHPYHIQKGDITEWKTAGTYAMVVTGLSDTVSGAADNAYKTLKQLNIPGSPMYRTDIGKKVADYLPELHKHGYATEIRYA